MIALSPEDAAWQRHVLAALELGLCPMLHPLGSNGRCAVCKPPPSADGGTEAAVSHLLTASSSSPATYPASSARITADLDVS
jgi:hypothetical protein